MGELAFSEKRDWLRLARTTTVGPVAFRDLLRRYGTPGKALQALPGLAARTGRRGKLKIPPLEMIEDEMQRTDEFGAKIITAIEPCYPQLLKTLDPPPPILTVIGDLDILSKPSVAVIGSRNASAVGLRFARQIAGELGEEGCAVISGLARGIDASAHAGALNSGTAAVVGGGVDHIYPRQNTELYLNIKQKGVIISESPIGYRATARDFPRRNRIISGLSLGVVVIEAAERSGTLITARYALEQNREVMAAPGSPLDPRTKGCNRLIRQGAALIENTQDILDVLSNANTTVLQEDDDVFEPADINWDDVEKDIEAARADILSLCSPTPTQRDEIIRQSGYPYPIAAGALLELEIAGSIFVEGDGRISLVI